MTKTFEKGNTIYFECEYRDFNGALVEPGSPAGKIIDSQGNEDVGSLHKKEDGIYYFYWTPSTSDSYLVEFSGTIGDDNLPGKAREKFIVKETSIT